MTNKIWRSIAGMRGQFSNFAGRCRARYRHILFDIGGGGREGSGVGRVGRPSEARSRAGHPAGPARAHRSVASGSWAGATGSG